MTIRRTRVIPCLLLSGRELVKTTRFEKARYVGDALNTVRIFNEKEVDELMVIDIHADAGPNVDLVRDIAGECFMPLTYGGGIKTLRQMESLFAAGCEKIAVRRALIERAEFAAEASAAFGSQSLAAVIDVRKDFWGGSRVVGFGGSDPRRDPAVWAVELAERGAGEIVLQSVDRDGTGRGYDLESIRRVASRVRIPLVALGGAASVEDFESAIGAGASAVAAGSMFVFHGKHRAVLVTYPSAKDLDARLR